MKKGEKGRKTRGKIIIILFSRWKRKKAKKGEKIGNKGLP